jgi:hypothetical protein
MPIIALRIEEPPLMCVEKILSAPSRAALGHPAGGALDGACGANCLTLA